MSYPPLLDWKAFCIFFSLHTTREGVKLTKFGQELVNQNFIIIWAFFVWNKLFFIIWSEILIKKKKKNDVITVNKLKRLIGNAKEGLVKKPHNNRAEILHCSHEWECFRAHKSIFISLSTCIISLQQAKIKNFHYIVV